MRLWQRNKGGSCPGVSYLFSISLSESRNKAFWPRLLLSSLQAPKLIKLSEHSVSSFLRLLNQSLNDSYSSLITQATQLQSHPFALQHLLFPGHWGCLTLSKRVGLGTVVEAKAKYWASCLLDPRCTSSLSALIPAFQGSTP